MIVFRSFKKFLVLVIPNGNRFQSINSLEDFVEEGISIEEPLPSETSFQQWRESGVFAKIVASLAQDLKDLGDIDRAGILTGLIRERTILRSRIQEYAVEAKEPEPPSQ